MASYGKIEKKIKGISSRYGPVNFGGSWEASYLIWDVNLESTIIVE